MTLLAGFLVFAGLSCWILAKGEWNSLDPDNPWKQILQPAVTAFQSRMPRSAVTRAQTNGLASNSGQPNEGRT
jgi:hypothetical protein